MRGKGLKRWIAVGLVLGLATGCATHRNDSTPRATRRDNTTVRDNATSRDKTAKGAGIGAAAGAATAVIAGKRHADQILIGAAIGGAVGAGVGAYMDAQEERLARVPGTTVERVEEDTLLVRFDSDILFGTDSTTLGPAALGTVQEVADVLVDYPRTAVVVQGHTDSTGAAAYNQDLSERRADSVEGALVVFGVSPQRLMATGYGETLPVASNASERGRQLNRRVAILLKAKAR
jgi:outer membrane protein OmpA-like peptidoglycan-associated protein